jgi:hypothetical protein
MQTPDTAAHRATLENVRRFVLQSHPSYGDEPTKTADLDPLPECSTDVMKVWHGETDTAITLFIAFTATRDGDKGDMGRNYQSLLLCDPTNPLDPALPTSGSVGWGWQSRWETQAITLKPALTEYAQQALQKDKLLNVFFAGHSLGGPVATLAGVHCSDWLRSLNVPGHTMIATFNSPRFGSAAAAENIHQKLVDQQPTDTNQNHGRTLQLHQLTCSDDPVQSLPLGMHHGVWHEVNGLPGAGSRNPQLVELAQRDNYNVPARASKLNPLANHDLGAWEKTILETMPDEKIDQMMRHTPLLLAS